MDFFTLPEDVSPEIIDKIQRLSDPYDFTWPIDYKYAGGFSDTVGESSPLVLDIMSHAGKRDHIFLVNEDENAGVDPRMLIIIAQAKLAETCSILSALPPVYIFEEEWYQKASPINYLNGYLSLFEKTSLIWAADLVEMNHPHYIDAYLTNAVAKIRQITLDNYISGNLKDLELYTAISNATIAKVMGDRFTTIKGSIGKAMADALMLELEALIPFEFKNWFINLRDSIYDNYADLPQVPLDGIEAALIVQGRTLLHAVTTPLTMHPVIVEGLELDGGEIIEGYFWTLDGNLFQEEIGAGSFHTPSMPKNISEILASNYNPN